MSVGFILQAEKLILIFSFDACVYLTPRQHESLLIPVGKLSCCSSKANGEKLHSVKPIKTKQQNSKTEHKLSWACTRVSA